MICLPINISIKYIIYKMKIYYHFISKLTGRLGGLAVRIRDGPIVAAILPKKLLLSVNIIIHFTIYFERTNMYVWLEV